MPTIHMNKINTGTNNTKGLGVRRRCDFISIIALHHGLASQPFLPKPKALTLILNMDKWMSMSEETEQVLPARIPC